MPKRPYEEVAPGDSPSQKRPKTTEDDVGHALKTLLAYVASTDNLHASLRGDLKSLSKSLLHSLPAIKALAEEEGQEPSPQKDSTTKNQDAALSNATLTPKKEPQRQPPKDNSLGAVQLPSPDTLTKWTPADIPTALPPLPPVLDPAIETAAFTHPGMAKRPTDMNYERLEWIGDSYLYVISCGLIYATFPTLSPGKCSQIRETLVKNLTLAEYSLHYGFDRRADFPAEFGLDGRPGGTKVAQKERTKVLADIFEAYVAAVVLSDPVAGFARASAWLKALWAGTIAKQIREAGVLERKAAELPPKNQLANLLLAKRIKLRYEDAPGPAKKFGRDGRAPLYTVNVFLDGWGENGKLLGWGTAQNKSEAGNRAAQCAMDNKKMIAVYVERKRAHMAALEAQRKEE